MFSPFLKVPHDDGTGCCSVRNLFLVYLGWALFDVFIREVTTT